MVSHINRALKSVTDFMYTFGSAIKGIVPAVRSADGTFGTQQMKSKEAALRRRTEFPSD